MRITTFGIALLILTANAPRAHAESSLAEARELYASAAYGDALAMLDGLASTASGMEEHQSIDLYRTLCLVALGRMSDADLAIETMIQRDPKYRATADELSPRLRTAFAEVRKRVLPTIIQKEYADAKTAFDKENFPVAAAGFDAVLKDIGDPDVASIAGTPPLSDLRTLATGFRDLSAKFAAPPPAPAPPPAAVKPVVPVRSLYSAADAGVMAPVMKQQQVPKYPGTVLRQATGMLEFTIDETGAVQSPVMRVPIDPQFDQLVTLAAKRWRYQPATLDGVPVKYVKRLTISVAPSAPGTP